MSSWKLPEDVKFVVSSLKTAGHQAYVVGGAVRDSLMGREPKDYDITTSATPEEVKAIFMRTIPTGEKHGTVTVMIGKTGYEVTTMRVDGEYSDSRRPDEVTFTTELKEDLNRRDFTINAIAYDGAKYYDPFGGMDDLKARVIKVVRNSDNRFIEDPLRILRAYRFKAQLGFHLSERTASGVMRNAKLLSSVSKERVRDELCKILVAPEVREAFLDMAYEGVTPFLLPELDDCLDFDQENPHHYLDVFQHTLEVVSHSRPDLTTRLAALLHDIAKPRTFSRDANGVGHFYDHHVVGTEMTEEIMRRLKFDNETISDVRTLVYHHMTRFTNPKPSSLKKFMTKFRTPELLDKFFDLQLADILGSKPPLNDSIARLFGTKALVERIRNEKQPLSFKDLAINGRDVMDEFAVPQGAQVGEMLRYCLDAVLEDESLNSRESLIEILSEKYGI